MKTSDKCIKCESTEVYSDQNQTKYGDRTNFYFGGKIRMTVDVYICLSCGYTEEYIRKEDLTDNKKREQLISILTKVS